MGDRVSIQFQKGDKKSVVFFSHWDGMNLVKNAKLYVKNLKIENGGRENYPIERMEPWTVMVDFISFYIRDQRERRNKRLPNIYKIPDRVKSNYYVMATPDEGDNSDNGHHIISLD
jgi:hypothetical protein